MAKAEYEIAPLETRSRDAIYNLLNIIHHELEGAALGEQFAAEAECRSDSELEEFFSEVSKASHRWAERARELLAHRRKIGGPRVTERALDSFSGTDVPAY